MYFNMHMSDWDSWGNLYVNYAIERPEFEGSFETVSVSVLAYRSHLCCTICETSGEVWQKVLCCFSSPFGRPNSNAMNRAAWVSELKLVHTKLVPRTML